MDLEVVEAHAAVVRHHQRAPIALALVLVGPAQPQGLEQELGQELLLGVLHLEAELVQDAAVAAGLLQPSADVKLDVLDLDLRARS